MIRLDYNIDTVQERKDFVNLLLEDYMPNNKEMELIADYLIIAKEKEIRAEERETGRSGVLTDNRMVTVNRRETSMEGLVDKLEGGESAMHGLIRQDKNMILTPKVEITQKDIDEIPDLAQLVEEINRWQEILRDTVGPDKYKIKKMLIEMRKDQYIIKNAFRVPLYPKGITRGSTVYNFESDTGYHLEDGTFHLVSENTIDVWNWEHISALLVWYSKLKQDTDTDLNHDLRWLLLDLERAIDSSLSDKPVLMKIVEMKIGGLSNEIIQKELIEEFGDTHSQEYISSLWRNKIPQIIADKFKEDWVQWFYTNKAKATWKTCTRCKTAKLALNRYFSINKTSASGLYSLCKECRNAQGKKK